MLITASILFIAFSLLYGYVTRLPLLLVVGAIHGALWSGILSSSSAIMSEYIPESRRMQGFAFWGLASNSAIAIAPAVGLWVFHFGWPVLCIEMAALSVIMTLGALLQQTHHRRSTAPARLAEVWDWHVVAVTTSLTALAVGYGGLTSYAAIFSRQQHITPESLYFTFFAVTKVPVNVPLPAGFLTTCFGISWVAVSFADQTTVFPPPSETAVSATAMRPTADSATTKFLIVLLLLLSIDYVIA